MQQNTKDILYNTIWCQFVFFLFDDVANIFFPIAFAFITFLNIHAFMQISHLIKYVAFHWDISNHIPGSFD